ncbi:FAD-dependent oxidoreductase [Desertibaculum subflavum]|uniref:FAD-dependent oxidoreductase n=1 Tax=Desertibaculum subflavum TaxID=2268458 RepID=UPI000E65ED78
MSQAPMLDVVVIGGGIAGLWVLDRLAAAGFSAILLERAALGAGQTIAAQGIIHGGAKYEVEGKGTAASESIAAMPDRWRASLRGERAPDLTAAKVLTERHLMLARGFGLKAELASRLLQARRSRLDRAEWPEACALIAQLRRVIGLEEPVVDVPSVLQAFAAQQRERVHRAEVVALHQDGDSVRLTLRGPHGRPGELAARFAVLAAGAANHLLLPAARQQLRPLHMVLARGAPGPLFAHLLVGPARPALTITSHALEQGFVWYLGGDLAERGVALDAEALIKQARTEIAAAFGAAATTGMRFATKRIDRAEGAMPGKRRPDGAVLQQEGRVLALWPTKLALAPAAAEQALAWLRGKASPGERGPLPLADWPRPEVAHALWEDVEQWN